MRYYGEDYRTQNLPHPALPPTSVVKKEDYFGLHRGVYEKSSHSSNLQGLLLRTVSPTGPCEGRLLCDGLNTPTGLGGAVSVTSVLESLKLKGQEL